MQEPVAIALNNVGTLDHIVNFNAPIIVNGNDLSAFWAKSHSSPPILSLRGDDETKGSSVS